MKKLKQLSGKFIYALLFLAAIPFILLKWAENTSDLIPFPAIESHSAGLVFISAGGVLMFWAMLSLLLYGKGLPMNAFPPPKLVTSGPYRIFHHPIYWGFTLLMTGWFLYSGSASGLWLVSPLTVLGIAALVLGYENIDLNTRFPDRNSKTFFDLPEQNKNTPGIKDRLAALIRIIIFLIISNFTIIILTSGVPPLFGKPISIIPVSDYPFLLFAGLAFLLIVPFSLNRNDLLREWTISCSLAFFWLIFIALLYPEIGAQYLPVHAPFLFIVPLALIFVSIRVFYRQSLLAGVVFLFFAFIPLAIHLSACRSALSALTDSIVIFLLAAYYREIWGFLKRLSEKIANSWKEWVFGKIRVINHGFYVGSGAFLGVLLAGFLAGKEYALALLVFTLLVTITSAVWAQVIEGSAKLKRPFGYYGGLVGIIFGTVAVWAMGLNSWVVIGVASVVMPWVQAMGRLRCLVNGCCHGHPTHDPNIGIRYFHYRSRVCNISGMKGELLHPTQLYSILWLFLVGVVLINLWVKGVSPSFIFGLYLILTSVGRFVEEAYRGETQTPVFGGLRLYQWTAVISAAVGILMTIIKEEPVIIHQGFNWQTILVAAFSGLFICFAMGVDFPYSNARFSRLV